MPWKIEAGGGGFYVVNKETGKKMSEKPISRRQAAAQLRALYASEPSAARKEVSSTPTGIPANGPGGLFSDPGLGGGPSSGKAHHSIQPSTRRRRKKKKIDTKILAAQVTKEFKAVTEKHEGGGHDQRKHGLRGMAAGHLTGGMEDRPSAPPAGSGQADMFGGQAGAGGTSGNPWDNYKKNVIKAKIDKIDARIRDLAADFQKNKADWKRAAEINNEIRRLIEERTPLQIAYEGKAQMTMDLGGAEKPAPDFEWLPQKEIGPKPTPPPKPEQTDMFGAQQQAEPDIFAQTPRHDPIQVSNGRLRTRQGLLVPGPASRVTSGRKYALWLHNTAQYLAKAANDRAGLLNILKVPTPDYMGRDAFEFLENYIFGHAGPTFEFKEHSPSLVETMKEFVGSLSAFKHLKGGHNQKRHGWRFGDAGDAKRAMRSGVSEDYAGKVDPKAERDEYKKRARLGGKMALANDLHDKQRDARRRVDELDKIKDDLTPAQVMKVAKRLQKNFTDNNLHYGYAQRHLAELIAESRLKIDAGETGRPKKTTSTVPELPKEIQGKEVTAIGVDPSKKYHMKYKVVELEDLIPSNLQSGEVNPKYDQSLQPRTRSRQASQTQIDSIARDLNPEALLTDFKTLDKGPMIVGSDNMVESGNGRVLALQRAKELYPEKYKAYVDALKAKADEYGMTPEQLAGMKNPVLVRERQGDTDRAAFARESNAPPVLQMSALEVASNDAKLLTMGMFEGLKVTEDQGIEKALRSPSNSNFVQKFLGYLSPNERAGLVRADGSLNRQGLARIKAAIVSRVFPGEAGQRLAENFLESLDSDIKNFETGLSGSLPELARAEMLIQTGKRRGDLSMINSISKSIDMLARLRETETNVNDYLSQSSLFGSELNKLERQLLAYFNSIGRSPKKIRQFFQIYASAIENSTPTGQTSMFGDDLDPEKLAKLILAENLPVPAQVGMF